MSEYCYDVIVIGGFGHVGLPLGIVLADAGLQVALYDIDESKRAGIESGRMPFIEYDAEPVLKRVIGKTLHIVSELDAVARARTVFITIGTPIDEYLNPKLRPMMDLVEQLCAYVGKDHCVILRSTVYPGTTQSLYEFFKRNGVVPHLAYCPERIVQGHAIQEIRKLPQIISGITELACQRAEALFQRLEVESVRVSVEEAELAKLFSNAWRYIQFAITNQFYMIATERGADFSRIYEAMTHQYDRAKDFPRPGFCAGPCLLKDTLQLAAFYGNHFQLGHAAMMVNEGLPNFIVNHLKQQPGIVLNNTRVGILGMAFKKDIDDIRDALSYKLAKVLRFHGARVVCSDEFVEDPTFVSKEELVATCPIMIVGVPHTAYKKLDVPDETHLVDLWNVIQGKNRGMSDDDGSGVNRNRGGMAADIPDRSLRRINGAPE